MALKKKKRLTTHIRVYKEDKIFIESLIKKGFFHSQAEVMNYLIRRKKRK